MREKSNCELYIAQAARRLVFVISLTSLLSACNQSSYQQTDVVERDTVDVQIIPAEQIQGLDMAIGQKLSIPDMDIEIVRLSEKEVMVKTPVRTETRTRTTFVPVKKVDKSRTKVDNSVRTKVDTDTDSSVRTVDKSRTRVRTKDVDKTRTKTVDKEVTRNGFPWWILILVAVLGVAGWLAKRAGKLPFI